MGDGASLTDIDWESMMEAFEEQPSISGAVPPGIQQIGYVRNGDTFSIGVGPLMRRQPGVEVGDEMLWAQNTPFGCLLTATSEEAAMEAIRYHHSGEAPVLEPGQRANRRRFIKGRTKLSQGRDSDHFLRIPEQVKPSYVPIPDGAIDVDVEALAARTVDIPDPSAGMIYVVVAEHFETDSGRETAFLLLPVHRVATDLTALNIAGDDNRYAQPLVTTTATQARTLATLDDHRHVRPHVRRLRGADTVPDPTRAALLHGEEFDPRFVLDTVERLIRIGGFAMAADA